MWSKSGAVVAGREAREHAAKARRKNLLYLIVDYLKTEGLSKSAEVLGVEACLSDEYKICDNIDLDIILQEYTNCFVLKFNKLPNITKRNDNEPKDKLSKNASKPTGKINSTNKQTETIVEANTNLTDNIKIKKITRENEIDISVDYVKPPFGEFIATVPDDLKCTLQAIYDEAKVQCEKVTWCDVMGLDNAKALLRETSVHMLDHPELFTGLASPWRSVLLYGPPGTGKTLLAKALAYESKQMIFNVTPSGVLSKWRGDSEKIVKFIFNMARYYAPSIIFVDEVEALTSKRDSPMEHEASRRLKSELLVELDGLKRNNESVLFLATSNLPWEIDYAMLRRMEKRLYVPLPNFNSRIEMFRTKTSPYCDSNHGGTIDLEMLAEATEGYSGSDIHAVCKEAVMMSIRKLLSKKIKDDGKHKTIVGNDALEAAIEKIKPSVNKLADKFDEWSLNNGAE